LIRYESTPNPNALKVVTGSTIAPGIRSYRSADEADDELSRAIFAIGGVRNVLLLGDWLTVGKTPETRWGPFRKKLAAVLADLPEPAP